MFLKKCVFCCILSMWMSTGLALENHMVAVVNHTVITQNEFNRALSVAKNQMRMQHESFPSEHEWKQLVLNQMIDEELQWQLAQQNHIEASTEQINAAIQRMMHIHHARTIKEFETQLLTEHFSLKALRHDLKKKISIAQLQQEVVKSRVHIEPSDIDHFKVLHTTIPLTEYHVVDHVFPISNTQDKETAYAHAQTFWHAIQLHPRTQAGGEDLGWRPLSHLPDLYANPLRSLNVYSATDPILTENGYHVLQLIGQRERAADVSNDQAVAFVYQERAEQELKSWMEQLKRGAYIYIPPNDSQSFTSSSDVS